MFIKKIHFFSSTYLVKILQRLSFSFLSIMLSCNDFLYNLSKDIIVCWSPSYNFLYLLYFSIIVLCNILLPNDKVHATPADIGKTIRLIPVIDKVIEVDVSPMITIESTDSNTVFKVLYFLYLFFDLLFLSLKKVIFSLMMLIWLLKC